jgi:hypothetical protein
MSSGGIKSFPEATETKLHGIVGDKRAGFRVSPSYKAQRSLLYVLPTAQAWNFMCRKKKKKPKVK